MKTQVIFSGLLTSALCFTEIVVAQGQQGSVSNPVSSPVSGQLQDSTAINLIKQMIAIAADNGGLGRSVELNNLKQQIEVLPKPKRGNRKAARSANDMGLVALNAGNYDEAKKYFIDAQKADLADTEISGNLGFVSLKTGDFKQALKAFSAALELAPGRSATWANLADYYGMQNQQKEAVACYALAFHFSQNQNKTRDYLQKKAASDENASVRQAAQQALELSLIKGDSENATSDEDSLESPSLAAPSIPSSTPSFAVAPSPAPVAVAPSPAPAVSAGITSTLFAPKKTGITMKHCNCALLAKARRILSSGKLSYNPCEEEIDKIEEIDKVVESLECKNNNLTLKQFIENIDDSSIPSIKKGSPSYDFDRFQNSELVSAKYNYYLLNALLNEYKLINEFISMPVDDNGSMRSGCEKFMDNLEGLNELLGDVGSNNLPDIKTNVLSFKGYCRNENILNIYKKYVDDLYSITHQRIAKYDQDKQKADQEAKEKAAQAEQEAKEKVAQAKREIASNLRVNLKQIADNIFPDTYNLYYYKFDPKISGEPSHNDVNVSNESFAKDIEYVLTYQYDLQVGGDQGCGDTIVRRLAEGRLASGSSFFGHLLNNNLDSLKNYIGHAEFYCLGHNLTDKNQESFNKFNVFYQDATKIFREKRIALAEAKAAEEKIKAEALKSGKALIKTADDAIKVYPDAKDGLNIVGAPSLSPTKEKYHFFPVMGIGVLVNLTIKSLESGNILVCEALVKEFTLQRVWIDHRFYFSLKITDQTKGASIKDLSINSPCQGVGIYTDNMNYTTVAGEKMTMPVFEALYIVK